MTEHLNDNDNANDNTITNNATTTTNNNNNFPTNRSVSVCVGLAPGSMSPPSSGHCRVVSYLIKLI